MLLLTSISIRCIQKTRCPRYETNRAVTIRASVAKVWPWLIQIGYQRGGFYSYDWLENLAGLEIYSIDQIDPGLQRLQVGHSVLIAPETPLAVARLEPNRFLVLHNTMNPFNAQTVDLDDPAPGPYIDWSWTFVLAELDESTTIWWSEYAADTNPAGSHLSSTPCRNQLTSSWNAR